MSEKTIAAYLEGMKDAEEFLHTLGFRRLSSRRKGWLFIDKFIRGTTVIEFLFGPPEWHCEIVVEIAGRAVGSRDLVSNPKAEEWIEDNKDNVENACGLGSEPLWWARLFAHSLSWIE